MPTPVPDRMKIADQLRNYYAVTILVIIGLTALVVPYPAEEVPAWKVLFIDENYLPGGNRTLTQSVDNDYFGNKSEVTAVTDKNGFVTFPTVYFWEGAGARMLALPARMIGWDTSTHVSVSVSEPGCTASVTWTVGTGSKPDKLVCPE